MGMKRQVQKLLSFLSTLMIDRTLSLSNLQLRVFESRDSNISIMYVGYSTFLPRAKIDYEIVKFGQVEERLLGISGICRSISA